MLVSLAARNAGAEHHVALMQDWVFLELPGLRTTSLGFDLSRGLASLAWLPRGVRDHVVPFYDRDAVDSPTRLT